MKKLTLEQQVAIYRADEDRKHEVRMDSIDDLAKRGLVLDTLAANHGTGLALEQGKRSQEIADAHTLQDGLLGYGVLRKLDQRQLESQPAGKFTAKIRSEKLGKSLASDTRSGDEIRVAVASGSEKPPVIEDTSRGLGRSM